MDWHSTEKSSQVVHAVFEGGGVRGIALAGAAAAALDAGYSFDQLVGTSAGSLIASLLAAGYTSDELARAVCRIDWPSLLDPVPPARIPVLGKHLALLSYRGLHHGRRLEEVWGSLLAAKGLTTFGDLPHGKLTVVATDLSHGRGVAIPAGLGGYGIDPRRFRVARAVRMSAAVPFLFRAVELRDEHTGELVQMADGAMAANFPVGLARRDRPVLGFRLVDDIRDHPHEQIRGPASLARAVVVAGIRARYTLPRPAEVGVEIVSVPVDADLDFDISPDAARAAFDRGRTAAAAQIARRTAA